MPMREVMERNRRGTKVVGTILQDGRVSGELLGGCKGSHMKKKSSLNVVTENMGNSDSMLSEKSTTRAMLKAPSSRTTGSGGSARVEGRRER